MQNIGSLFDCISNRYDKFNHITSFGIDKRWRRQAVSTLPKCEVILDVATGTADICIEIIRQQKAENVIGVDLSNGMLQIGDEKINRKQLSDRIELKFADCAQLPFPDNTFDAVTCAYGVRNFENLTVSLNEIYRVLKSDGQLRILEFTYPQNKFIRFFYDIYFTRIMPFIGKKLTDNPEAFKYFMNSVKHFAKGKDFLDILDSVGFSQTAYKSQTFGISTIYSACKK